MLRHASNSLLRSLLPASKTLAPALAAGFSNPKFEGPFQRKSSPFEVKSPMFEAGNRAQDAVAKNTGMAKFITRMYNTTALSIAGAVSAGYFGAMSPLLMANPQVTSLVSAVVMFGSFLGVQFIKPRVVSENPLGSSTPIFKTENPASRLFLYGTGVLSLGLSASPLFAMYASTSVVTTALALTAGIFGGASAVAYMMPKDKMLGYGKILGGSLLGLISMQLIGLGSLLIVGPNPLSMLLFQADTYLGVALFTGLIAYDTHVAIKQYEEGNADHLGMSVQLLLDFWNLLIRIMQILGRNRN